MAQSILAKEKTNMSSIVRRVIDSKWLVMVAGMYLMASAGAAFDFSVYSQSIKTSLGLDQRQLNTISFFLGLGDGVGFIAGLLYDFWLPSGTMAVGALLNSFGYLMAWLAMTGRLFSSMRKVRVWHLSLFLAIGANAQTFPETAVMVVCLRNFPRSRGTVLGLVKGFYGLSGAILPQIYYALFGDHPVSFLLLAGVLPSVVSLLCMFLMRYADDTPEEGDGKTMRFFQGVALTLAMYLMVILVIENVVPSLSRSVIAALTSLMIAIMCLPLAVVVWSETSKRPRTDGRESEQVPTAGIQIQLTDNQKEGFEDHIAPQHPDASTTEKGLELPAGDSAAINATSVSVDHDEHAVAPNNISVQEVRPPASNTFVETCKAWIQAQVLAPNPPRGEDHSIAQALLSLDFWILFVALTCGLGAVMAFLNNMAQVGYSQNYSTIKINTMVALVSIWNFFGRIVAGSLSDMCMDGRSRYPSLTTRPALFCISIAILVLANLLIALGVKGALYIGSILSGLSLGAQYTLTAVIVSELFGLKGLGTLYTVLACAGPLGQYILSIRVAGALYDQQARKQNIGTSTGETLLCKGTGCFQFTFFITTGVTALGTLVCVVLTLRTMAYYKRKASTSATQ